MKCFQSNYHMLGTYALSAGYYDAYYKKAQQVRTLVAEDYRKAFETVDVIAGPTTPTTAFRIGEKVDDPLSMFMVDLARSISIPVTLDFMAVASYGASTQTSGIVRILKDLDSSIEGKDVLIVEDIIDSGLTLNYILDTLHARNPASLRVCSLLSKPARRRVDVPIDYICFEIPDEFVVGYGLDFNQIYRNLPFVGVLKPELYTQPRESTAPEIETE